jgi:ferredoxin
MAREIRIDRELCMGSGQCLVYAGGTFDQDDDTVAVVIDPYGDSDADIRTAAERCPTRAITFVEQDQ